MFLLPLLLSFPAAQNLVLNGDFESNTSSGCDYNLPNATFTSKMSNCYAYGPQNEIDIMDGSCYGPTGPVGSTKISLANDTGTSVDALTMALSGALTVGQSYTLRVYLYAHIESWAPSPLPIEIGVSTSASAQGTVVATFTPSTGVFTEYTATFAAPIAATHLSLQVVPFVDGWTHVDGVVLEGGGLQLDIAGACPGVNTATVTGATPSGSVAIGFSATAGSFTIPGGFVCGGTVLGLGGTPTLAAVVSANASGTASLAGNVPAALCGFSVQAVDLTTCATSNVVTL